MTDKKISDLTAATLPLAGTEQIVLVQAGETRNAPIRAVGVELPGSIAGSYQDIISSAATSLGVNLTNLATGNNRLDLGPFTPARTTRIQSVGTVVANELASGLVRILCYASDDLGLPAELLWVTGDIACDVTGYVSDPRDFTFVRGRLYWLGVWTNSIGMTLRAAPSTNVPAIGIGSDSPNSTIYATTFRRTLTFTDPAPDPWGVDLTELATGSRHIVRWQTQALP